MKYGFVRMSTERGGAVSERQGPSQCQAIRRSRARPRSVGWEHTALRVAFNLQIPKIPNDGGVKVTIYRTALTGSEKSSEKSSEKLLALIAADPDITIKQMAAALGLSTRAVEKQLSNLQKKNLLARDGANRGGRWKIL